MVRSALSVGSAAVGFTIASINPGEIVHLIVGLLLAIAGVLTSLPKGVRGLRQLDEWWTNRLARRRRRLAKLKRRPPPAVFTDEESEL